jgi:hypothetical protein
VRLFTVVLIKGLALDHPAHVFVRARLRGGVRRHPRRGVEIRPDADIDQAASLLMATLDGLSIQRLLDPSLDAAVAFEHLVQQIRADLTSGRHLVAADDLPLACQVASRE